MNKNLQASWGRGLEKLNNSCRNYYAKVDNIFLGNKSCTS